MTLPIPIPVHVGGPVVLTDAQRDGRACVNCAGEDGPMIPAGTLGGVQIFRHEVCPARPVDLDGVGAQLYAAYKSLGEQIADLETKRERVREQLEARIGDAPGARVDGKDVITWKWNKPGQQLDAKALAKDHPDIYTAYLRPKKAARPFKILGEE